MLESTQRANKLKAKLQKPIYLHTTQRNVQFALYPSNHKETIMQKILTTLCFSTGIMFAIPTETVIVGDAQGAVQHSQVIAQFVEAYKKYEQMIEAANNQINKLNEINNLTNKANDLINNGNLNIANPMQVVENLNNTLKSIKRNVERLSQSARDYELQNAIRKKQLQAKCSWLNVDDYFSPNQTEFEMTQTGEETAFQADAKILLETFTDIKANDIESLNGSIKGLPLALIMCDRLNEYERQLRNEEFHSKMQNALLNGDFKEYRKQQQEQIEYILEKESIAQQEFERRLMPLKVRMEQMRNALGVTDTALAEENGIKFCHKNKNGDCTPILLTLDYVKNKEAQMLEKAKNNSNNNTSQSQADREFLMLDYLREIATHMSFLNETMAMTASLLADEQERISGIKQKQLLDEDMLNARKVSYRKEIQSQKNAVNITNNNAKLDKFGFPQF